MIKKNEKSFLYKRKIARTAVTSSSARKQPKGTIDIAQKFLAELDMASLKKVAIELEFQAELDTWTAQLQRSLKSKSWGHARKFLNLFLYLCSRDYSLRKEFLLDRIDSWLEIPMDKHVGESLLAFNKCSIHGEEVKLPWKNISTLEKKENVYLQLRAKEVSRLVGLSRADLDLLLWRRKESNRKLCIACYPQRD